MPRAQASSATDGGAAPLAGADLAETGMHAGRMVRVPRPDGASEDEGAPRASRRAYRHATRPRPQSTARSARGARGPPASRTASRSAAPAASAAAAPTRARATAATRARTRSRHSAATRSRARSTAAPACGRPGALRLWRQHPDPRAGASPWPQSITATSLGPTCP
jgi:hypothetical protein